jgi:tRNA U34 5-carboxymethylaminomethyl modifying GTPase MnmE/TrmE
MAASRHNSCGTEYEVVIVGEPGSGKASLAVALAGREKTFFSALTSGKKLKISKKEGSVKYPPRLVGKDSISVINTTGFSFFKKQILDSYFRPSEEVDRVILLVVDLSDKAPPLQLYEDLEYISQNRFRMQQGGSVFFIVVGTKSDEKCMNVDDLRAYIYLYQKDIPYMECSVKNKTGIQEIIEMIIDPSIYEQNALKIKSFAAAYSAMPTSQEVPTFEIRGATVETINTYLKSLNHSNPWTIQLLEAFQNELIKAQEPASPSLRFYR